MPLFAEQQRAPDNLTAALDNKTLQEKFAGQSAAFIHAELKTEKPERDVRVVPVPPIVIAGFDNEKQEIDLSKMKDGKIMFVENGELTIINIKDGKFAETESQDQFIMENWKKLSKEYQTAYLNGTSASDIIKSMKWEKAFEEWIKEQNKKKNERQENIRDAYQTVSPEFYAQVVLLQDQSNKTVTEENAKAPKQGETDDTHRA